MATLLRKVKSTIHATTSNVYATSNSRSQHHIDSFGRTRQQHQSSDLNTTDDTSHTSHTRSQDLQESGQHITLAQLRRQLVHKASTINLRSKNRRSGAAEKVQRKKSKEQELLQKRMNSQESEPTVRQEQNERQEVPSAIGVQDKNPDIQPNKIDEEDNKAVQAKGLAENSTRAFPIRLKDTSTHIDDPRVGDYTRTHSQKPYSTVKMSAEASTPPVPFARLKEISDTACASVFTNVSVYDHSSTETWNTTIINDVLGTLVKETTPTSSSTSSAQPQFKYIVNSTIIQHAATSSGDEPNTAASGRRGMHAASGAYWNNEKDGMFSYKYEAAESKGLDVIIGITWIWIG